MSYNNADDSRTDCFAGKQLKTTLWNKTKKNTMEANEGN